MATKVYLDASAGSSAYLMHFTGDDDLLGSGTGQTTLLIASATDGGGTAPEGLVAAIATAAEGIAGVTSVSVQVVSTAPQDV